MALQAQLIAGYSFNKSWPGWKSLYKLAEILYWNANKQEAVMQKIQSVL